MSIRMKAGIWLCTIAVLVLSWGALPQPDPVQLQQGESYGAGYAGVIVFVVAVVALAYGLTRGRTL